MIEIPISQTGLNLFIDCEYAYKLKYINLCDPIFFSMESFLVGSIVHDDLNDFYRHKFYTEITKGEILYETYQLLKKYWEPTLAQEDFTKAYQCLVNHSDWLAQQKIFSDPITERHLVADGWHGYIDFIDMDSLKVIDWKTNKRAVLSASYRRQAEVYRILCKEKYEIDLDHFYFFFLYTNEWRTVKFDNAKQQKVAKEIYYYRDKIWKCREKEEFAKNPRTENICKYCPYRYYCKTLKI